MLFLALLLPSIIPNRLALGSVVPEAPIVSSAPIPPPPPGPSVAPRPPTAPPSPGFKAPVAEDKRALFTGARGFTGEQHLMPIATNCVNKRQSVGSRSVDSFYFPDAQNGPLIEDNKAAFPKRILDELVQKSAERAKKSKERSKSMPKKGVLGDVILTVYGKDATRFEIAKREFSKQFGHLLSADSQVLLKEMVSDPLGKMDLIKSTLSLFPAENAWPDLAKEVWSMIEDPVLQAVHTWSLSPGFYDQLIALKSIGTALSSANDFYTLSEENDGALNRYLEGLRRFTNKENTEALELLLKNLVDWVNLYNSRYAKTFDAISGFKTAALEGGLTTPYLNRSLVDLYGEEGQLTKAKTAEQLTSLSKDCEMLAKISQLQLEQQATEVQNELATANAKIEVLIGNEKLVDMKPLLEDTEKRLYIVKNGIDAAMMIYKELREKIRAKFMEPGAPLDAMFANLFKFFQRLLTAHAKWTKRKKVIAGFKPKQVEITNILSEVDEKKMVDGIRRIILPELMMQA